MEKSLLPYFPFSFFVFQALPMLLCQLRFLSLFLSPNDGIRNKYFVFLSEIMNKRCESFFLHSLRWFVTSYAHWMRARIDFTLFVFLFKNNNSTMISNIISFSPTFFSCVYRRKPAWEPSHYVFNVWFRQKSFVPIECNIKIVDQQFWKRIDVKSEILILNVTVISPIDWILLQLKVTMVLRSK